MYSKNQKNAAGHEKVGNGSSTEGGRKKHGTKKADREEWAGKRSAGKAGGIDEDSSMVNHNSTTSLVNFLKEIRQTREFTVKDKVLEFQPIIIDRFTTLAEIRHMVTEGQNSAESIFDIWPPESKLLFALDDKVVLTRVQEERTIVWELLENKRDIYVRQKGNLFQEDLYVREKNGKLLQEDLV